MINSFASVECGGKHLLNSYKIELENTNPGHRLSLETIEDIVVKII